MSSNDVPPTDGTDSSEEANTYSTNEGLGRDEKAPPNQQAPDTKQQSSVAYPKPILPVRLFRKYKFWWKNPFRVRRPKSTIAEAVTVFVTIILMLIGFLQYGVYRQQKKIMESTGPQTQKLIDAANIQACAAKQIADASIKNATAADDFATSAGSINTEIGFAVKHLQDSATNTHALAEAAKSQSENTKESLRQSNQTFRASERPYVVFGRKDGVVAEFTGGGDKPVGITVFLQNSGHLPALTACTYTEVIPDPSISPRIRDGEGLTRQRGGTKNLYVVGNLCPSIAGGAEFEDIIDHRFPANMVDLLRKDRLLTFLFETTVQYCTSFGEYYCKSGMFDYEREPFNRIRLTSEQDCSNMYRGWPPLPPIPADNELLFPCAQPGEEEQRQKDVMKSGGWKPFAPPPPPSVPKK